MTTTYHYLHDRQERKKLIQQIGYGKVVKSVVIDRGHKKGAEIHQLSDTGIITIYNQFTHKLITKLIANPHQVRRYYTENETPPKNIVKLAYEHTQKGYNYCQRILKKSSFFYKKP